MIYRYYADVGGWRLVVLIHEGRKWIRFVDISTFRVFRRSVRERTKLHPCDLKPVAVAKGMAKRRTVFRRCAVPFAKRPVQSAIDVLRRAP